MFFNHLKHKVVWIGTRVSIFLRTVADVSRGILGALVDRFLHHQTAGSFTSILQATGKQQSHFTPRSEWKDEFLQALQV